MGLAYHPNFLVRIAGEPIELIEGLSSGESVALHERCERLRADLQARVPEVCASLERAFKRIADRELARRLLSFKRDLFNLRRVDQRLAGQLAQFLEPEERPAFEAAVSDTHLLEEECARITAVHDAELANGRARLREHFGRANLRNGVRYANVGLFEKLRDYYERGVFHGKASHARKLDDTFLQYLLRSTTKTSPLSSFTPVCLGRWSDQGEKTPQLHFEAWGLHTNISLKRALLLSIVAPVLQDMSVLDPMPVRINPTLKRVGEQLEVRRVEPGNGVLGKFIGVGTSTAKVNLTRPIGFVVNQVLQHQAQGLTLRELRQQIAQSAPGQDPAAITRFLAQLIELGVLMVDTGYEEQGDIHEWMRRMLDAVPDPSRETLLARWSEVEQQFSAYLEAQRDERAVASRNLYGAVEQFAAATGAQVRPAFFNPVVYEDCFHSRPPVVLHRDALAPIRNELDLLLRISPLMDFNSSAQSLIARRFIEQFGPEGICRKPVSFLEQAYEELFAGTSAQAFEQLTQQCPLTSQVRALRREFYDAFLPKMLAGGDVAIDLEMTADIARRIPEQISRRAVSHCFLGQFVDPQRTGSHFVLNQTFPGTSYLFSRYLDGQDEAQTETVRAYLRALSTFGHPLELPGVFGFNANVHPALADAEIGIPAYYPNRNSGRRVSLADLALAYDEPTHRVYFLDGNSRRYEVFYFGFLTSVVLPPLQRLLAVMYSQGLIFHVRGEVMARRMITLDKVSSLPRVTFGSLVLSRATTYMPRSEVPDPELPEAEFFRSIQKWRQQHGLPREVFVRLLPLRMIWQMLAQQADPGALPDLDRTELKPLYMDFSSPLLVRLFGRLLKRNTYDVAVQEALPNSDDPKVIIGSGRHVAEWQIELARGPSWT